MADDLTLNLQFLSNPSLVHRKVLQDWEDRSNGVLVIPDVNNGPMQMLSAFTSIVSDFSLACEKQFAALHPIRTMDAEDLYRHMSDMDYLHITSAPASLTMRLLLSREYIVNNAVYYSEDYSKVVIPQNTIFTIGGRHFGIYYPIEIRVNNRTDNIIVTYDTTVTNRLHTLSSNLVDMNIYTQNGLDLLLLSFPVYQFSRVTTEHTVTNATGFRTIFSHQNKFYAARLFTKVNGKTIEFGYTLSQNIYDTNTPTAILTIMDNDGSANGRVKITIPQIYFTRGQVGPIVTVELYSTEGAIDVPLSQSEIDKTTVNFGPSDELSEYSSVLVKMSSISSIPEGNRIVGGQDGISTQELRRRIITNTLYDKVPITPEELKNAANDKGFNLTKYKDNVTDRVYYMSRKMLGGKNTTIPVTVGDIVIDTDQIESVQSIIKYDDNSITILPTTIYHYSTSGGACTPLTDSQLSRLAQMNKSDLANELNSVMHTRMPFHLVLYSDARYPMAKTFNLNNPKVNSIKFVRENSVASSQMVVRTMVVNHLVYGTGGYKLALYVYRSGDLVNVDPSLLYVLLTIRDKSGRKVYLRANYVAGYSDGSALFEAALPTTYRLSQDGYFSAIMNITPSTVIECDLNLDSEIDVRMLIDPSIAPNVANDSAITNELPLEYINLFGLAKQSISVTFGEDMSSAIYNRTVPSWGSLEYARYLEPVYETYPYDVPEYVTLPNGTSIPKIEYDEDDNPHLVLAHRQGDTVLDSSGNPVIKHTENSIIRDVDGNPIVLNNRKLIYYVESMMFDGKLYASENTLDEEYRNNSSTEISNYVNIVTEIQSKLLERTKAYFKPVRSIGSATFEVGNGNQVIMGLGLSFAFKVYVSDVVVVDSEKKKLMTDVIHSVVEENMIKSKISLTEISEEIKSRLKDMIVSIDIGGVNGIPSLQTIFVTDTDAAPMVALKLVVDDSGQLTLVRDITIEWASDTELLT